MKVVVVLAGAFFSILQAKALSCDTSNTIRKLNFYFSFDVRRSLVNDIPASISGLKAGITLWKRHTIGIGYYNMGAPILGYYISKPVGYDAEQTLYFRRTATSVNVETRVELSLTYVSLFYEHRLLARRKWNIDGNLQYGLGETRITALNRNNGSRIPGYPQNDRIHLLEGSVMAQYKIFTWLGAGAGVGYRYMLDPDVFVTTTFNYPIWVLKLMIFPGKLWKVIKKEEKWYR